MNEIPEELITDTIRNEDVNLLVGDNGSGKSQMLLSLSKYFQKKRKKIIVIANSIHDKFEIDKPNIYALRDRVGRRKAKITMRKAIENINNAGLGKLKNASLALQHANFDPYIGIKLSRFNPTHVDSVRLDERLPEYIKEDIVSLIYKVDYQDNSDILWVKMDDFSFSEINQSTFTRLVTHEKILKRHGIISEIEYFLSRNGLPIPLYNASSGELSVITSLIYISTVIDDNTIILIDEPENSLHPKWQKNYVAMLLDNFYKYQPRIIIATHSPLVLNGALVTSKGVKVFKANNFQFILHDNDSINIESAFADYFDVITPANRSLSKRVVDLMNQLIEKKITNIEYDAIIDHFKEVSYDEKQKVFLTKTKELGARIYNKEFE